MNRVTHNEYEELLWTICLKYYAEQTDPIYAERYLEIKKLDWRLTMHTLKEGYLILDVGSGKPVDAIRAAWFGARIISLDLSVKNLVSGRDFIRRELPGLKSFCDFIVADATMLPFKNGVFDVVTSFSAIEHVDSEEKVKHWIKEMSRVVKDKGKIVITTENKLNLLCFFFNPFRLIDYKKIRHQHALSALSIFVLFWLSKKFKSLKKYVPLRNDYYEWFFTPHQFKELLIEQGLIPELFDSNTLYYWGYAPPYLAFTKPLLKIDHIINKFEKLKCLRIFGKNMGFICSRCNIPH